MTIQEYCSSKRSEITLNLIESLKKFSEEDDFVLGTLAYVKDDIDRGIMLDYIEQSEDASYENIILLSLELNQNRKKVKANE